MRAVLWSLVFSTSILNIICNAVIHDLSLNSPETYLSSPNNDNTTYFKFVIKEIIPDEDLAVIVRPADFKSDPDVFISERNPYPSPQINDQACFQYGYDVCFIPKERLAINKIFYIAVNCPQGTCKFHISVLYAEENLLTFNQTFEYYYQEKGNLKK